ncbi:succinate dehydrogenase, hydrophobic membrane anchor protein [Limimaricola pyoseonensis]|uniref:Succinate dehydrogenase hydrophobic membrane anchor subunit n=1 Tax=Limimaricola pyoseonensis TaxID=521013 RepID=A0A1G7C4I9_9RHOB|nr:succinate dehydrogenase, hydrophobic membrane anchor protein [Limimaricola pyoseonensis]SDE34221.1 succinate dehydrogenase subunit D [Limimaricola pyoseonensis]
MAYLTDRKRAHGLGASHSGTKAHWRMSLSSVALVLLVPLFVFTFGAILGSSYEEVVIYYQRPLPAVIALLTFLVGFWHFRAGAKIMIEDYSRGLSRKALLAGLTCLSYGLAAIGAFAVIRLAL